MFNISLRAYANWVLIAACLTIVLIVSAFYTLSMLTHRADTQLNLYQDRADSRVYELSTVVERFGYGGMIHNYKNFVLRGDPQHKRNFDMTAGAIKSSLESLRAEVEPQLYDEIDIISATVDEYMEQIEIVAQIRGMDNNVEGIDSVVEVDNSHAFEAFSDLTEAIAPEGNPTRARLLLDLRHALGYGGMIHEFKIFVIRNDNKAYDIANQEAQKALDVLDRYGALDLTAQERTALNVVRATIAGYRDNLRVARSMARDGASAHEIDEAVVIDDGPALSAMKTLDYMAQQEVSLANAALHQDMKLLERSALFFGIGLAITALIGSAATWLMLKNRVAKPARQIAYGLAKLAEGDTNVDLSEHVAHTEIGQIAAAAESFRKTLVENRRVKADLTHQATSLHATKGEVERLTLREQRLEVENEELRKARSQSMDEHTKFEKMVHTLSQQAEMGDFSGRITEHFREADLQHNAKDINNLFEAIEAGVNDRLKAHDESASTFAAMEKSFSELQNRLKRLEDGQGKAQPST